MISRRAVRLAAALATAAALALTGLSDSASAATTAPTGSLVIQEDSGFLQNSLQSGIVAIALPNATVNYNAGTGFSGTFPVTGGSVNLGGYYGAVQLGGSLLVVNATTGRTVDFTNLAFDAATWAVTGMPLGSSTPVNLFDPAGNVVSTKSGTTQNLSADDLEIDPAGAQYADTALGTTFFAGGQHVGTTALSFTAGS
ncbi:hypothetical protein [Kitasatospora acidiphila]|uniref:hypothetical protein n=1 Tax=Kitasatospora acidiphila TaxID=2567942 RepID=UPI003C77C4D4